MSDKYTCCGLETIRAPQKTLGIGSDGDSIGLMKPWPTTHRANAFTRIELFVVIGVLAVLVAVLLPPALAAAKRKAQKIHCVKNVSDIRTAFSVWKGDHSDRFPMQFALTNSETMGLISSGKAYVLWQTMSNEFKSPASLFCPADANHVPATNFTTGFSDSNISYFFSLDATEAYPQMILDGDDNLAVNDVRVKPGILILRATNLPTWTKERHRGIGTIGLANGWVIQTTPDDLKYAVIAGTNGGPVTTCRWVIP